MLVLLLLPPPPLGWPARDPRKASNGEIRRVDAATPSAFHAREDLFLEGSIFDRAYLSLAFSILPRRCWFEAKAARDSRILFGKVEDEPRSSLRVPFAVTNTANGTDDTRLSFSHESSTEFRRRSVDGPDQQVRETNRPTSRIFPQRRRVSWRFARLRSDAGRSRGGKKKEKREHRVEGIDLDERHFSLGDGEEGGWFRET